MKRSKIIVELIKDTISVVQAMDILNLLLQDNNDKKIKDWINSEVNGYNENDNIPDYRILDAEIVGNYIVGNMYNGLQCTNQTIPIKSEYTKTLKKIEVSSGLNEILQLSLAEKGNEEHSLIMPLNVVMAQQATIINGQIISANRRLTIYAYTNILNKLKSKVLNILIELEKKYGNLDDYYIDFANKKEEKEINKTIINIIHDNSIKIGDKNKIESSNIGDSNEN